MSACDDCRVEWDGATDARRKYQIEFCPLHAAAEKMLKALKMQPKAISSLMGELGNRGPATDWGLVNDALLAAAAAVNAAEPKPAGVRR